MNLYILENKTAKLVDYRNYHQWMAENQDNCQVALSHIYGLTVDTRFRGYDENGAGYLFYTRVTGSEEWVNERYEAQTWERAECYHGLMCERILRDYKRHLIAQAHIAHT